MENQLYVSLIVLISVASFLLFVAGYLFYDVCSNLSTLLKSLNITTNIVNKELTPTVKELQVILKHLSSISNRADQSVNNLYDNIDIVSTKTTDVLKKAQLNLATAITGVVEGFNNFIHKNKPVQSSEVITPKGSVQE